MKKWPRWFKVPIGLCAAYVCAVLVQVLLCFIIVSPRSKSLSEAITATLDYRFWDWYLGSRAVQQPPASFVELLIALWPVILYCIFPHITVWIFITICLSIWFFFPILMEI